VHRHYLDRESNIFRSYSSGTEDNPIPLPGVLPEEFEALVEYFYDGVHGNMSRSTNEWIHLLSISTRFKMEKIRQRAITELEENFGIPDPVEKIIVAVKNNVPAWLEPAYVELCQRKEPIRSEEAERLGLSIAMKLARAREYVRDPVWVHHNPPGPPRPPQPVQSEWEAPRGDRSPRRSIGWDLGHLDQSSPVDLPQSRRVPSPIDKRLDTAHVERVVRLVFWPRPPGSTPGSKGFAEFFAESDDEPPNTIVSKKNGKKSPKK